MKFSAQPLLRTLSSSTRAHVHVGHDPAKGLHSYSTAFLVQLGVLPTSTTTTTTTTITTATRWKERGEEEKGARIRREGDGGRGIDMHLSSGGVVVASGCRKSRFDVGRRRRDLSKIRETCRAESFFRGCRWVARGWRQKWGEGGRERRRRRGEEGRQRGKKLVLRTRFREYCVDATDVGGRDSGDGMIR